MTAVTQEITVLVADDHAVVRAGIRHILESMPGVAVVAEATDGPSALRLAREQRPDVIILDVSMPGGSGLGVLAELRRDLENTRILMLSMHDDAEYIAESVRAGTHGYLLKDSAATDLRAAVRAVMAGETFFSPELARPRVAAIEQPESPITRRERQVLVRVAAGGTNKEIAADLGISHRTVETHRESIARKLGISSVAGQTRYVIEHHLTDD
ncbi:MAG TPA: response regulator transcription factor [Gemmatimonadaceae bacterium]|nr:response regulator transcription factor [Gemmatimonadaceae bacterium]